MTGEFRLLDKRNGLENAAVPFYRSTIIMSVRHVALYADRTAIAGHWQKKTMIIKTLIE